ncbi:MAG: ABC transporter ATP-binding protein [Candidatus Rokubacteria bacterium]|nr:ABC transporter ATP-binding protein [Candidatus Rokubacteria bacterium]
MLLEVRDVVAGYGKKTVLRQISLEIAEEEVVAVIGHNGAGKTTLLRTIFGLLRLREGQIRYQGARIDGRRPALNVREGIAFVPQGHGVFPDLSVRENLELAADAAGTADLGDRLEAVFRLFPILRERDHQKAGTLSGGQQQMLALGMALVMRPKLLLLDEPSLGLAPFLVQRVLETVIEINRGFKTAVLLVEQNVTQALRIAGRVYVMKVGRIVYAGDPGSLAQPQKLWQLF